MKTLLIAAHPRSRELLMEALKRRKHEITVVEDADAARAALQSGGYRLVVLEADGLPGEGPAVCRRLREISKNGPCVILAAGESRQPEHIEALFAAGADDYLTGLDDPQRLEVRLAVAERRVLATTGYTPAVEPSQEMPIDCCPLLYHAPYGVFRCSLEGKFLEVNPALVAMLGYDSDEELLAADTPRDVCRDLAHRQTATAQMVERGHVEGVELYWKRRDGTPLTVLFFGRTVCDDSDPAVRIEGIVHDVTEQNRTQEALKVAQARLQYLVSSSPAVIYTSVPSGDYGATFISENVTSQLGYEAREFVEDPRFWANRIHPEDAPRVFAELPKVFETGYHAHEYRFLHKDGSYRWMRDEFRLFRDAAGQPLEIIGFWIEITEHKRAEEALKESERRFRAIFDNAVDGILLADVETREFPMGNQAMCQMLGYSQEEIRNLGVKDIHPEEDLPHVIAAFEQQANGKYSLARDIPMKRKDGSVFCADVNSFAITLAGKVYLAGIFRDVTERKQAADRLRASEQRYRLIADNVSDVIFSGTLEGLDNLADRLENHDPARLAEELLQQWQFTYVSPSVERFLGYDAEEVMTLTLRELLTADSYADAATTLAEELVAELQDPGKHGQRTLEAKHLTKDGSVRWGEVRTVFLRDEQQRVVGLLGVSRDVTQRKQAAQALQKEQQLLRQLLDLHEGDRRLMAYEIHDGFSQYLTGAMYNLQGFRELQAESPLEAWKTFDTGLALIRRSIDEARRLIGGLRPPILDESGIVPAIDYLVCETEQSRGAEVEFIHDVKFQRLAPPLESAIFRIVQESLTNAHHHSQSAKIRIELLQRDDRVHIAVRDWGIGFNPAGVGKGRFGLQGIRERVRLLGGQVTIETAPDKGTLISVELPLVEPAGEPSEP